MICRYKIKFISDIEQKIRKLLVNIAVAPFVGVWIEIIGFMNMANTIIMSLPSWECGLKCYHGLYAKMDSGSLPSWECGLKFLVTINNEPITNSRSLRGSVD